MSGTIGDARKRQQHNTQPTPPTLAEGLVRVIASLEAQAHDSVAGGAIQGVANALAKLLAQHPAERAEDHVCQKGDHFEHLYRSLCAGRCGHSGLALNECRQSICDCFDRPERPEPEGLAGVAENTQRGWDDLYHRIVELADGFAETASDARVKASTSSGDIAEHWAAVAENFDYFDAKIRAALLDASDTGGES